MYVLARYIFDGFITKQIQQPTGCFSSSTTPKPKNSLKSLYLRGTTNE
jgi:hypothetical protein